jgi:hypothetical protein
MVRRGTVLVRKKFTQKQLLAYTANMQTTLIGLEASSGQSMPTESKCNHAKARNFRAPRESQQMRRIGGN